MTKSREEKINAPLEYISVSFFIIPLFLPFPDWYIILETVVGLILIGFTGVAAGMLWVMLSTGGSAPEDQNYFTLTRAGSGIVTIIILTSMYLQGLDELFIVYLLAYLAYNVGAYMWMKKPA